MKPIKPITSNDNQESDSKGEVVIYATKDSKACETNFYNLDIIIPVVPGHSNNNLTELEVNDEAKKDTVRNEIAGQTNNT